MQAQRTTTMWAVLLLLIAGTTVGASAQADGIAPLEPPSEFTGRLGCPSYWQAGAVTNVVLAPSSDGNLVRREVRGASYRFPLLEVSDPRFAGTWTVYMDSDQFVYPGVDMDDLLRVISAAQRIENDDGEWLGSDYDAYVPGAPPSAWDLVVLEGEGAYAGYTALTRTNPADPTCECFESDDACIWDVRGVVIAGELPPTPEATR